MKNFQESKKDNPPKAENLIGDAPFDITAETVKKYLEESRAELAGIKTELPDESNEKLKQQMIKREAEIGKFLEVSPGEILYLLQEVYNFVYQLEAQGLLADDIVKDMSNNKPKLAETVKKFYGILRSQTWGYLLGQRLLAFRAFNK